MNANVRCKYWSHSFKTQSIKREHGIVDFSQSDPKIFAGGSDDCLWNSWVHNKVGKDHGLISLKINLKLSLISKILGQFES